MASLGRFALPLLKKAALGALPHVVSGVTDVISGKEKPLAALKKHGFSALKGAATRVMSGKGKRRHSQRGSGRKRKKGGKAVKRARWS